MDFEGNLHSRELESEIGLTFDTDFQDRWNPYCSKGSRGHDLQEKSLGAEKKKFVTAPRWFQNVA